jgi:hypothetical protein
VLRFQRRIYEELQGVGERPIPEGGESSPEGVRVTEAGRKANELGAELKNVTQLYNDYAVPFQLWETSLEILHFSSYEGDSGVLVRMWERLIAQGLEAGGVGEAAGRVRRVGGRLRVGAPGGGSGVPLEDVAYMLETAAHERTQRGQEIVSVGKLKFQLSSRSGIIFGGGGELSFVVMGSQKSSLSTWWYPVFPGRSGSAVWDKGHSLHRPVF